MDPQQHELTLNSPDETDALARRFATCLTAGDVLLLSGDVGAGKTHFARALIRHVLHEPEDVPSPTFTLVQTYDTTQGELWHADLYRLTDASELEELGLTEAFETAICLIEWPDRLGNLTPTDALSIELDACLGDDTRVATLRWSTPNWTQRLGWLR